MESLTINTQKLTELIDITAQISRLVEKSRIRSGICILYVPHTTAGITINESYDPDVAEDITALLNRLIPSDLSYRHTEGNADAHIKSVLIGTSLVIPIEDHRLALGRWQGIFFCEFDGPRTRECRVKIIGDRNKSKSQEEK
ncbi:MAG: secondary thiamine-phosphate synthase enzyme YjbQ [candidate division WOR-3 bacterium]